MKRIILVLVAAFSLCASFIIVTRSLAASNDLVDLVRLEFDQPSNGDALIGEVVMIETPSDLRSERSTVPNEWVQSIQNDIRSSEYYISWQTETYLDDLSAAFHTPNRAHNLRTYFTPDGIRVLRRTESDTSWELAISLTSYGYAGSMLPVSSAEIHSIQNRIEYVRGSLIEWYLNEGKGLEQGFILEKPLDGDGRNVYLDLAVAGDLVPSLTEDGSSILFTTGDGENVLFYTGLYAYDATGNSLPASMKLVEKNSGTDIQLVVDTLGAEFPIVIDPTIEGLTADYSWNVVSLQEDDNFGASVATAGDVNGDNFDDVIIGAPTYDNGQEDEGMVFVYYGTVDGLETTPAWTAEINQAGANFGVSVGSAGDVNNDTYDDVVVGANFYTLTNDEEGGAFVYHGSGEGLSTSSDWDEAGGSEGANFGHSVGTAGDVDDDGYDDVIIGAPGYTGNAYVFPGSSTGLSHIASWTGSDEDATGYGISVGTAGDVNGDNHDDVIVGVEHERTYTGGIALAYYWSGSNLSSTPDWTVGSTEADTEFGVSVGTAGDVNGDGYDDVIVGAPGYSGDHTESGMAYVYHGSDSGLSATDDWSVEGDDYAGIGRSVGTAGDVNGDNYTDIVFSTEAYATGRVYVYQGSPDGLGDVVDWYADGESTYSGFGIASGTAGDVNGDGLADVIVGARGISWSVIIERGAAYVYHGLPDLIATNDSPTALDDETTLTATTSIEGSYSYDWDLGDGEFASGAVVTHTYDLVGVYTAIVTATEGATALTDTTLVTIDESIAGLTAENDSPTVLGGETSFTATITSGSNVTYAWDFGDGNTGSSTNPAHTYAEFGDYTATVTVTNSVSERSTTTDVTVDEVITGLAADNDSPTALGDATNFTATISAGSSVIYAWDFGDGNTDSGQNPAHTYAAVGDYTTTVTATNSLSEQSTTTEVTVDEVITGLAADNDSPTELGDATNFTATITAGSRVTYAWDFGDGNTGSGTSPAHTYAAVGDYTATVTATNGVGEQSVTTEIMVDETITSLAADNDGPTTLGETTRLTATISAGSRVTYVWDFGDGSTGSGANLTYIYSSVGSFVAKVTASNSVSEETTSTIVTIQDTPIEGLTAENDGPTFIGSVTTLTASVTSGSNVTYEWDFGDGSPKETGAVVNHVYPAVGMYFAKVTAKNGVSAPYVTTVVTIINYENYMPLIFFMQQ